jgi:predicted Zn-dependent peptidase
MQAKNVSVAFALRLAMEEMRRLREEPASAEELRVIKDNLIEAFPSQWGNRQAVVARFSEEAQLGWPEDWWVSFRDKIQAVTPAEVQRLARRLLVPENLVILAVGKAAVMEAGDPDHPGTLAAAAQQNLTRLPLRDPFTLKPLP